MEYYTFKDVDSYLALKKCLNISERIVIKYSINLFKHTHTSADV